MVRLIQTLFVCAALCGCATSGGLSSLSGIGGTSEPEKVEKPAAPAAVSSSSAEEGSSLGGIWSNFSSAFSSGAKPVSQKSDTSVPLDANEALRLVNEYRAKNHLHPLTLDPRATMAAAALTKDMALHDHMSHYGPDGQDVGKRLAAAGYTYRLAAENVGVGQPSLAQIIEGWKKSPPHSRNMLLADVKNMGIALEYKPDTKYKAFWALVVAAP